MKCPETGLSPSYAYKKKCRCGVCKDWRSSQSDRTDPDKRAKAAELSRQWRLENLERSRDNAKRWQAQNPDKVLAMKMRKYGLTVDDYQGLLDLNEGCCHICGGDLGGMINGKRLAVDHCHDTGKVRGLLCGGCNIGLGHFRDDPELLRLAASYLEQNNG